MKMDPELKAIIEIAGLVTAIALAIIAKAKNWFPFKGEIVLSDGGKPDNGISLNEVPVTFGDLKAHCDRQQQAYKQVVQNEVSAISREISEWKGGVTQRLNTGDEIFKVLNRKMDHVQTTLASLATAVDILTQEIRKNNHRYSS